MERRTRLPTGPSRRCGSATCCTSSTRCAAAGRRRERPRARHGALADDDRDARRRSPGRGVIVERDRPADAPTQGARGRPAAFLALDPSVGAALGLDFDHDRVRVAVATSPRQCSPRTKPRSTSTTRRRTRSTRGRARDACSPHAGVDRERVIGVGVGLAEPDRRATGTVGSPTILPELDRHAARRGAREAPVAAVEVENDANLGAWAEQAFGAGREMRRLRLREHARRHRRRLVIGRELQGGATGFAGEIGHVAVEPAGALCRCGNRGCLETVASSEALVSRLRHACSARRSRCAELIDLVHAATSARRGS